MGQSRGSVFIGLIIFVILVLIISGILYYFKTNPRKVSSTILPSASPAVIVSPKDISLAAPLTKEQIADWKEYKDPKFGYSFLYDPSLNLKKNNGGYIHLTGVDRAEESQGIILIKESIERPGDRDYVIAMGIQENPQKFTLKELLQQFNDRTAKRSPDPPFERKQYANEVFLPYTNGQLEGVISETTSNSTWVEVTVVKGDKIYSFGTTGVQGDRINPEVESIFQTILSTFKFPEN